MAKRKPLPKHWYNEIREARRVIRGLRKLGFGAAIDADLRTLNATSTRAKS